MVCSVRTLAVVVGLAVGLVGGCVSLKQGKEQGTVVVPSGDTPNIQMTEKPSPYSQVPVLLDKRPEGLAHIPPAPELDPEPPTIRIRPPKAIPTVQAPPEEESSAPEPPAVVRIEPPPEDPLVEALRHLRNNRRDEAVKVLHGLEKPNQELVLGLLQLASRLSKEDLDKAPPPDLTASIQQLEQMILPLRHKAPVRIDKLCFCKLIRGFGLYEPVNGDPPTFLAASPGREGQLVHVYAEVSNFTTRKEGNEYVSSLASSFEVRNAQNEVVWEFKFPNVPDRSRSPRRDYFITYQFRVPPQLKPGHWPYTLRVKVQDLSSNRPMVWNSLDFRVVAPAAVPAPRSSLSP